MPRKDGASARHEPSRKRRRRSWLAASKKRSRRANIRRRTPLDDPTTDPTEP